MCVFLGGGRLELLNRSSLLALALMGIVDFGRAGAADQIAAEEAATVADAMRVLDLTTFPALNGAKEPVNRSVSRLSYRVPSDCQTAFDFQRTALSKLNWSEVPGSTVTKDYGSGMFRRDGFLASVSVSPLGDPAQPGMLSVSVVLHGNIDLAKLPIPTGLNSLYSGPQVVMYSADTSVAETAEACRKLLVSQGWQPYGKAGDTIFFKQNAIRLTVGIAAAPARDGKTSVTFSAEQLSADLPAPSNTVQLQYADSTKQVLFDTKESEDAVVAFYRKSLGRAGWRATTDSTVKMHWKSVLLFRNSAKDMLTLEMYPVEAENVLRVTLKHQSAAEVAKIEKQLSEQVSASKKEKDVPTPEVTIALPSGARLTEKSRSRLEFTVAAGRGKAVADSLRKMFRDDGWKEDIATADAMIGEIAYTKDKQEVSLSYVETGFTPAEFTITAKGVQLELRDRKE